jgi:hypothetical protein
MSAAAQEVLLSHVNKDVKLTTFLGRIQLPMNFSAVLFRHLKKAIALLTERRYGKDLVGFLGSPFSFQRTQTIQQLASSTQKCRISGLLPTSAASLNQDSLDSRAPFETAERYGTSKRLSSTMAADGTSVVAVMSVSHQSLHLQDRHSERSNQDSFPAAQRSRSTFVSERRSSAVAKPHSFAFCHKYCGSVSQ